MQNGPQAHLELMSTTGIYWFMHHPDTFVDQTYTAKLEWAEIRDGDFTALLCWLGTNHYDGFLPSLWAGTCRPAVGPPATRSLPAVCCVACTPAPPGPPLWCPLHLPTRMHTHRLIIIDYDLQTGKQREKKGEMMQKCKSIDTTGPEF